MDSLVSSAWLAEHLGEPDLVVLDCSVVMEPDGAGGMATVSGRAAYESGHVPGAAFADLLTGLADTASPNQFAVPTPPDFCAAVGRLGVGDGTRVVLYDSMMSMWAARVWWMLRWVGFDDAALLDGGFAVWTGEGRPVSTEIPSPTPRTLTPSVRDGLIADIDEVRASLDDGETVIVDTLPADHYAGRFSMYGRPGHLPGAINLPVFDLLDEGGRFRPHDELAARHATDPTARTITYCGGGIAASAGAFAMTRLGFTDVAVYTASLQEWARDPDNPLVVGD